MITGVVCETNSQLGAGGELIAVASCRLRFGVHSSQPLLLPPAMTGSIHSTGWGGKHLPHSLSAAIKMVKVNKKLYEVLQAGAEQGRALLPAGHQGGWQGNVWLAQGQAEHLQKRCHKILELKIKIHQTTQHFKGIQREPHGWPLDPEPPWANTHLWLGHTTATETPYCTALWPQTCCKTSADATEADLCTWGPGNTSPPHCSPENRGMESCRLLC